MKTTIQLILSISILFLLSGCSRKPLTSLPNSAKEYQLSKDELVKKYPEIARYEGKLRLFFPNYPPEKSVLEKLGAPDKIKRDWWYPVVILGTLFAMQAPPLTWGIALFIRPDIPKRYYYKKEGYCIEVLMDRTFVHGYREYMHSWNWKKTGKECD